MRTGTGAHGVERRSGGYVIVLFVVILAFVGVVASMQVLILTSVATTSRAFDAYQQGAVEQMRLQRVVAETLYAQRQVAVTPPSRTLASELDARLAELASGGATLSVEQRPASLPPIVSYPDALGEPEALGPVPEDLRPFLTPELERLCGPAVSAFPEAQFLFSSRRKVLDLERVYRTRVAARLVSVPLTRFPIAAYDLPSEIGQAGGPAPATAASDLPAGLVPGRDRAFVADLQAQAGTLPYHFRHRAALAASYQALFSQAFVDRVAEFAGITHFHRLGGGTATALLAGMTFSGATTGWDVGVACTGTFGTVAQVRNVAVIYADAGGKTLRLNDSAGGDTQPALLLVVAGPADRSLGPLVVEVSTITRPIVVIGYNVRLSVAAGTAINGAIFLDPDSSMVAGGKFSVGHLSYWAGSTGVPEGLVVAGPLPAAARHIAPRVAYVATADNPP
jgi:hypothetical protein